MIIIPPTEPVDAEPVDASDTISVATLVPESRSKIPRKLIYSSLLISLLAFIFALVANVNSGSVFDTDLIIAPILAFWLTLPHHGISFLLMWLQKHQSESILRFSPHSPRSIGYCIFLTLLWVASTAACSVGLQDRALVSFTLHEHR